MTTPAVIQFRVFGIPKPQPRARSFVLRGKGGRPILSKTGEPIIRVHEAGTAENWKSLVADAAREFVPMPPLLGPLRVDIHFVFPRPKAHYKSQSVAAKLSGAKPVLKPNAPTWYCMSRNDRDNLDKAVLDALTVIGMWKDDGQVCAGEITKCYECEGMTPGAFIRIEELGNLAGNCSVWWMRTVEANLDSEVIHRRFAEVGG